MKRIIAIVLAMTMAFSMVACGGKADERRVANLTEEETKVIEIFAGAYEGMELEDIKADFAVEDLEAYKAELIMEGADKEAYIALLDEMHAAEEMTVEDATKYAILNRFYAGLNFLASSDLQTSESEETKITAPTEEELAPYKELAAQGKMYAKLYLAVAEYAIAHPEIIGSTEVERISGMVSQFMMEMLGDMLAGGDFGDMMGDAIGEAIGEEAGNAIGDVLEDAAEEIVEVAE